MKKVFLLFFLSLVVSQNASAVAYDASLTGCGTIQNQLLKFDVDDTGWYYISIPFGNNKTDFWQYLTPLVSPFQMSVNGATTKSFFVVTDFETNTPVVGKCTN